MESRLFKIHDVATNSWGPTAWDTSPSYPADSPSQAMTSDGTNLFYATSVSSDTTHFYARSPVSPGPAQEIGTTDALEFVTGISADAMHFYVVAVGSDGYGVYRLERANLAGPPVKIANLPEYPGALNTHTALVIDDTTSAAHLYARDKFGNIRVVIDPGGQALDAGVLSNLGLDSDLSMTYDRFDDVVYFFETESSSTGRVVRLQ
jgi:hypothetical protein